MPIKKLARAVCLFFASLFFATWVTGATPTQPEIDAVNAEIKSDDKGKQDAAIAQINDWINSAHPIRNIWVDWIPGLMKDGRNEEAAEVALAQCGARADLPAIYCSKINSRPVSNR
jgi:hypothetical protein